MNDNPTTQAEINERIARAKGWRQLRRKADDALCWVAWEGTKEPDWGHSTELTFAPTTDWRDCGPLLEELALQDLDAVCNLMRYGSWKLAPRPHALMQQACLAWLAWKEKDNE